ncbi:MAG: hypothetical protein Kow00107_11750 [Planctomycetota bacterium]
MSPRKREYTPEFILRFAANYSNQRSTIVLTLFEARPLAELREALDRFRSLRYMDAIRTLTDKIISRQVSPDYYHMALCYIARSYARLGDIQSAEIIAGELDKVPIPASYTSTANSLREDVKKDIDTCRSKLAHAGSAS